MQTRTVLFSDAGKILTNGENYGRQIFLTANETAESYYEISEDEYNEIEAKKAAEFSMANNA